MQTKTNVGRADYTAIGFEIVEMRGGKVIKVEWDQEMTDADPDALLSKQAAKETQRETNVQG